jgi:riboflavin synthase
MFTGIITNQGVVVDLGYSSNQDLLLKIATNGDIKRSLNIGCSIAINGVCLTLIAKQKLASKTILSFQVSKQTLKNTSLKNWQIGKLVNLEFSLMVGDELGGHMVLGHVDDVAKITKISKIKASHKMTFSAKKSLLRFIAKLGSVCLDGVSLTVTGVTNNLFSINLIPHSFNHTNFKELKIGDEVNIEIDPIARYLQRLSKK